MREPKVNISVDIIRGNINSRLMLHYEGWSGDLIIRPWEVEEVCKRLHEAKAYLESKGLTGD